MGYGCQLWGQRQTQVLQNTEKTQNKVLRIINFKNPWEPSEQIRKESKIFQLKDIVTKSNLKFLHDQMNKILQGAFENFFINKMPFNIFIIQEKTPLMFYKSKQRLMPQTHSHCRQFEHGISSKTKSTSLHYSLT